MSTYVDICACNVYVHHVYMYQDHLLNLLTVGYMCYRMLEIEHLWWQTLKLGLNLSEQFCQELIYRNDYSNYFCKLRIDGHTVLTPYNMNVNSVILKWMSSIIWMVCTFFIYYCVELSCCSGKMSQRVVLALTHRGLSTMVKYQWLIQLS